jgi:uncharacterized protein YjbI with pentapeptide repeats
LGRRSREFEQKKLIVVDLSHTDLRGADLSELRLDGSIFVGADLDRANLAFADLSGATLTDANLVNPHLSKTNLSAARLDGANINWAYLKDAFNLTQQQIDVTK